MASKAMEISGCVSTMLRSVNNINGAQCLLRTSTIKSQQGLWQATSTMPEVVCDLFEICSQLQPPQPCLKLSVADWWAKQFYAILLRFALFFGTNFSSVSRAYLLIYQALVRDMTWSGACCSEIVSIIKLLSQSVPLPCLA